MSLHWATVWYWHQHGGVLPASLWLSEGVLAVARGVASAANRDRQSPS